MMSVADDNDDDCVEQQQRFVVVKARRFESRAGILKKLFRV